jgi:hypothetical protein
LAIELSGSRHTNGSWEWALIDYITVISFFTFEFFSIFLNMSMAAKSHRHCSFLSFMGKWRESEYVFLKLNILWIVSV